MLNDLMDASHAHAMSRGGACGFYMTGGPPPEPPRIVFEPHPTANALVVRHAGPDIARVRELVGRGNVAS